VPNVKRGQTVGVQVSPWPKARRRVKYQMNCWTAAFGICSNGYDPYTDPNGFW